MSKNTFRIGAQKVPGQVEAPEAPGLSGYAVVRINVGGRKNPDYLNSFISDGGPADSGDLGCRTIVDGAPTREAAAAKALKLSKLALERTSEFAYGVMRSDAWNA